MRALEPLHILTLQSLPGIDKALIQRIVDYLQSTQWDSLEDLSEVIGSAISLKKSEFQAALKQAEQTLEESQKANIQVIGINDVKFPQPLRIIKNPPLILYIKGDIQSLHSTDLIAVIGTREPSQTGKEAGKQIAKRFTEWGWNIVSGLALGCDTAAHEGCLEAEGQTMAFLAHGLQMIYPAENYNLAQSILDFGGCLVSEYPLGTEVLSNQFIERDRLQSGLSSAVIVVETEITGSTMHTVNFCLEQNKPLACLSYNGEYSQTSRHGNQKLINQGKATSLWELETVKDFEKFVRKVQKKPK